MLNCRNVIKRVSSKICARRNMTLSLCIRVRYSGGSAGDCGKQFASLSLKLLRFPGRVNKRRLYDQSIGNSAVALRRATATAVKGSGKLMEASRNGDMKRGVSGQEGRENKVQRRATSDMRSLSLARESGKRWKISEIGLAIPLQACPDMGLYCSFAFIAFDYKLASVGLFVAPRAHLYRGLKKKTHSDARVLRIIILYSRNNAPIDHIIVLGSYGLAKCWCR